MSDCRGILRAVLTGAFVWTGQWVAAQTGSPAPEPTATPAFLRRTEEIRQFGNNTTDPLVLTLQMLAALAFVLGVIVLMSWLAKKYLPTARRGTAGPDAIVIQSVRSIGPRRSLLVVRVRGRNFLLGSTASAITRLADLDMPPGTEGSSEGVSFAAELAAMTQSDQP